MTEYMLVPNSGEKTIIILTKNRRITYEFKRTGASSVEP